MFRNRIVPMPLVANPIPTGLLLAAFLSMACLGLPGVSANPLKRDVAAPGNEAFQAEDYERAASEYVKAQDLEPLSAGLDFNLGASFYRQEDYPRALEMFEKATRADDAALAAAAFYNLGNARYKSSKRDFEAAVASAGGEEAAGGAVQDYVKKLEECIKDYEETLKRTPDDEDAKFNIETIRREIKNLMRRQPQDQQQQNQEQQQDQQQQEENQDQSENQEQQQSQQQQQQESGEQEENQDPSEQQDQESQGANEEQQQSASPEQSDQGTPTPEPRESEEQGSPTPAQAAQAQENQTGPTPIPTLSISEEMARNLLDNLPEQRPRTRQQRQRNVEKDW